MRFNWLTAMTIAACTSATFAGDHALIDTTKSPDAKMYMVDLADVHWDGGLWGDRFDVCKTTMLPHMWELFQDDSRSHAWGNYLNAAGIKDGDGKAHGPPFNDGDFLKWFEGVAQTYAITKDPSLDQLMDKIIAVVVKAQREDGYLGTKTVIAQRNGEGVKEFADREHFETYNMGHLMTAACVHYRATGKTTLLDAAKKAADYLYNFYKTAAPDLARNAICPSHYMGVAELYRATGDPKYLELAKQLIEIRDLVSNGADQNQDALPFRKQTKAVGHAVRANYLYAGVADVYEETGDKSLLDTLTSIADDVAAHKLYITGQTGALYDGASPDGSKDNTAIELVHQAYGRDFELPNLTSYNETCATIGYAMWDWRMLTATGDARYADLFEQTMYNGVLPGISLEGKDYLYVNPLKKLKSMTWPLRFSRTRQPNIPSSFCCPPNIVRTIAEAQDYIYTLSKDTLWVHLYGGNTLDTNWTAATGGGHIKLHQETNYPWDGAIKLTIDAAPDREIALQLRVPGWSHEGKTTIAVNGKPIDAKITPATYCEVKRQWKAGDVVEVNIAFEPVLIEANPLVEETLNQVAVRNGPIVYCLESNDLPADVKLEDVALPVDQNRLKVGKKAETVAGAKVQMLTMTGLQIVRDDANKSLYHEVSSTKLNEIPVTLVPYYAWGNRGDTEMSVWLPVR